MSESIWEVETETGKTAFDLNQFSFQENGQEVKKVKSVFTWRESWKTKEKRQLFKSIEQRKSEEPTRGQKRLKQKMKEEFGVTAVNQGK